MTTTTNDDDNRQDTTTAQRLLVETKKEKVGKVVVLHGFAQNAVAMNMKTKTMTKKLNQAGYDVVFWDAPHVLPPLVEDEKTSNDELGASSSREDARAWFFLNPDNPLDTSGSQNGQSRTYHGLQVALRQLEKEFSSGDDDDDVWTAVFGFSQGAVMVHMLASLAERQIGPFERIGACVIASGLEATHDGRDNYGKEVSEDDNGLHCDPVGSMKEQQDTPLSLPSFHLIGKRDTNVVPELSLALAERFDGARVMYHEKGHLIPQTSADCAAVVEFLNASRNTTTS